MGSQPEGDRAREFIEESPRDDGMASDGLRGLCRGSASASPGGSGGIGILRGFLVSTAVFLGLRDHRAANCAVNCDACWAILGRLFALSMPDSERQQNFEADPFSMFLVTRWQRCSSDACYLLRKFLEGHQLNCKTQFFSVLRKQLMRQVSSVTDKTQVAVVKLVHLAQIGGSLVLYDTCMPPTKKYHRC